MLLPRFDILQNPFYTFNSERSETRMYLEKLLLRLNFYEATSSHIVFDVFFITLTEFIIECEYARIQMTKHVDLFTTLTMILNLFECINKLEFLGS